jgi:hypothetical protein
LALGKTRKIKENAELFSVWLPGINILLEGKENVKKQ